MGRFDCHHHHCLCGNRFAHRFFSSRRFVACYSGIICRERNVRYVHVKHYRNSRRSYWRCCWVLHREKKRQSAVSSKRFTLFQEGAFIEDQRVLRKVRRHHHCACAFYAVRPHLCSRGCGDCGNEIPKVFFVQCLGRNFVGDEYDASRFLSRETYSRY